MSQPISLTTAQFNETIQSGTTLVDFWAPWCGPCLQQLKVLDQLAEQAGDDVTIAKVNVDEEPDLAQRYAIRSIPTLLVIRDGEVQNTLQGLSTVARLQEALASAIV